MDHLRFIYARVCCLHVIKWFTLVVLSTQTTLHVVYSLYVFLNLQLTSVHKLSYLVQPTHCYVFVPTTACNHFFYEGFLDFIHDFAPKLVIIVFTFLELV